MDADAEVMILSNRGPLGFARRADGTLEARRGGGGLVVSLGPGAQRAGALWAAAATTPDDQEAARAGRVDAEGFRVLPVALGAEEYRAYYDVVANQTLWFCVHGMWDLPRRPRFDRHWWKAWETFKEVNGRFASAAAAALAPGGTALVQDYQLALVPKMLAELRPDAKVASFLHTPWCCPQELAVLPDEAAVELLAGLAGGGPVGFHSPRWAGSFRACCDERLGATATTFVSPGATDADDLRAVTASAECRRELDDLASAVGDRRLIVRVDRIELSKNVLRGFWAFDDLLEQRPDLRGEVVFAAMVYPSRAGLAEYQAYAQEVQTLVAHINARWGQPGWTPILLDPDDNHPRSVAALRRYDVLLVNPIRDGLNLVAKEGPLVNERDGVVVLSRHAGVFDEIGGHTLAVNPFDVRATADALARALDMVPAERAERAEALRKVLDARNALQWFDEQLAAAGGGAPA